MSLDYFSKERLSCELSFFFRKNNVWLSVWCKDPQKKLQEAKSCIWQIHTDKHIHMHMTITWHVILRTVVFKSITSTVVIPGALPECSGLLWGKLFHIGSWRTEGKSWRYEGGLGEYSWPFPVDRYFQNINSTVLIFFLTSSLYSFSCVFSFISFLLTGYTNPKFSVLESYFFEKSCAYICNYIHSFLLLAWLL